MTGIERPYESVGDANIKPSTIDGTVGDGRVEIYIPPPLSHEESIQLSVGHLVAALESQFDALTVSPDNETLRLHYPVSDALTIIQPADRRSDTWPPEVITLSDMSRGYGDRQRLYGVRQRLIIDRAGAAIVGSTTQHNLAIPPVPSLLPVVADNITHWANIIRGSNVIGVEDYRRRIGQR